MEMNTEVSNKKAAFWVTLGTVVQIIFQVIAIVVLARLLSPQEFGIVSAASLVTQLSLIFTEFGVGPYVVHRKILSDDFLGTSFRLSCLLAVISSAILWTLSSYIADCLHVVELIDVLKVYAAVFLINGTTSIHLSMLQRRMDFRYLAYADILSFSIGYSAISITFAYYGFSYWSLIIGHLSQALIKGILIRKKAPEISTYKYKKNLVSEIITFGFGQTLSRIGSFISSQADGFIITNRLGVDAIGYYGRANQVVTMPIVQLGQIFDKLLFPIVARLQDKKNQAANTYYNSVKWISFISFPFAIIFYILSDSIVYVLLGDQWEDVSAPLKALGLAIPFRLIHKVSDPTARGMGATYSRAWRQWTVALSVIVLTLLLSQHGLFAIALGILLTTIIDAILMLNLCCKLIKLKGLKLAKGIVQGIMVAVLIGLIAYTLHTYTTDLSHILKLTVVGGLSIISLVLLFFLLLRYERRSS